MNRRIGLLLALPLMMLSSCNGASSYCGASFISPEVPAGDLTTASFFHYGNALNEMCQTITQRNRVADGYDYTLGTYHQESAFTFYNSDIIRGTSFTTFTDHSSQVSEDAYTELRYISDGYIHLIHDEEEYINDYRVSYENTGTHYRDTLYIGMSRDYFKYFGSTQEYDANVIVRSGHYIYEGVALNVSYITLGHISEKLDLEVEIKNDLVTKFTLTRSAYEDGYENREVMSETIVEDYLHGPKADFPWGVIDWFNYNDYPAR